MLKAIDILLGVAVVMLVFSAMVTIITQFVINFRNMKGKHLLTGLADLLEQLSPGINRACAEHIAGKVLTRYRPQKPCMRTVASAWQDSSVRGGSSLYTNFQKHLQERFRNTSCGTANGRCQTYKSRN